MPPSIRLDGDKEAAKHLIGFGKKQLRLLKESMGFQNLFQRHRTLKDNLGRIVHCQRIGNLDQIYIFVPPHLAAIPPELRRELKTVYVSCWCCLAFAEGRVTEVIEIYGHRGYYGEPDPYPANCSEPDALVANYRGIRYRVEVCQKLVDLEPTDPTQTIYDTEEYVAIPSDFAEYKVGDEVILLCRGEWNGQILNHGDWYYCTSPPAGGNIGACWATRRPGQTPESNLADGTFIIVPLHVVGINDQIVSDT